MITRAPFESASLFPRRALLRITIVLAIHALVLLALIADRHVQRPAPPQTVMLMTVEPPKIVKPPPPPEPKKPRTSAHEAAAPPMRDVQVPPRTDVAPVIVEDAPPVAPAGGKPDGVGTAGAGKVGAGVGGPAAEPVTVGALIDPANCPPIPLFPGKPHLVGTVILAVLIDVDGRVTDARIARSSGRPILDQTALEGARQCRFVAATVDKVPVASWEAFRYSWGNR